MQMLPRTFSLLVAFTGFLASGGVTTRAEEPVKNSTDKTQGVVIVEFAREYRASVAPATSPIPRNRVPSSTIDATASTSETTAHITTAPEALYTCSMHPKIRWPNRDPCPICGMRLQAIGVKEGNGSAQRTNQHDGTRIDAAQPALPEPSVRTNGQSTMNGMNHSSVPGMDMKNSRTSKRPHAAMAMRNGSMQSRDAMGSGTTCPACMAMNGGMSDSMPTMRMNGSRYPMSEQPAMRMDHDAMQGQGSMSNMIMGCGACMQMMMGNTHDMTGSRGQMPVPSRTYDPPMAPMGTMQGRCGC